MAMTRENVRRKLKGLLAVAAHDSGATPGERDTAANLAEKLMKMYGLTRAEVEDPVPEQTLVFQWAPTYSSGTTDAHVVFTFDETY